jgi:uncharacterized protein YkwD
LFYALLFVSALFGFTTPQMTSALTPPSATDDEIVALVPFPTRPVEESTDESAMLADVNRLRAQQRLAPLRTDAHLQEVARAHALDMLQRRYFGHVTPEGESPFDRMRDAGIAYGWAGENLALNRDEPSAERALWNSPRHRANLLESHFTHVGIAAIETREAGEMIVQLFSD